MADNISPERRQLIEEQIKDSTLKGSSREHFVRLIGELESDDDALIIMKGHLVLEERITAVIEKFVFHPEYLDKARLSFAQKVNVARTLSLDESGNSLWMLIDKLNSLRNRLSHSLDGDARTKAMKEFVDAYTRECDGKLNEYEDDSAVLLTGAIAMCLGFIHSVEQEVERFKEYVAMIDRAMNSHRQNE